MFGANSQLQLASQANMTSCHSKAYCEAFIHRHPARLCAQTMLVLEAPVGPWADGAIVSSSGHYECPRGDFSVRNRANMVALLSRRPPLDSSTAYRLDYIRHTPVRASPADVPSTRSSAAVEHITLLLLYSVRSSAAV